jgi:ABC-type sugar transport system permease subunit
MKPRVRVHGNDRRARRIAAAILLAPMLLVTATFLVYPVARNIQISFYRWDGLGDAVFVGLANYREVFADQRVWGALLNTLTFAFVTTLGVVGVGYVLAAAIYNGVRGARVFRVVFFIPVLVPLTMTAVMWKAILDPTSGPLNQLLESVGVANPPQWLADTSLALWTTIGTQVWQYAAFPMVVFLAAMDRIPPDIQDAATLDGTNAWQRVRHITFPLTERVVTVMGVVTVIAGLKVFDIVYVLTNGGPGTATDVVGLLLWKQAFSYRNVGYAASIAVLMTILILVFSAFYVRLLRAPRVEL